MDTLQQLILVFQFVFAYDLLIKLNKTFTMYIYIVETNFYLPTVWFAACNDYWKL